MRIVSFISQGRAGYGLLRGEDEIVDCSLLLPYPDVRSALAAGNFGVFLPFLHAPTTLRASEVSWLPPVTHPDKIICVGLNYRPHLLETGRPEPDRPTLFLRLPSSQVGQSQPLLIPPESVQFDYEGELAVVIGKGGRRITQRDAMQHVAGYACYNDGSVRDWQRHSSQFTAGKNFRQTAAFGPWIVSADEIPDPRVLTLKTLLNGQVMQQASVGELIFSIPALIEYCSTFTDLLPGDVLVTGTPGGVGAFRQPPVWMKAGDRVEIAIAGIGTLSNPVIDDEGFF
ncbi:fumarylacetoacetate hydrolase family protein [Serratia proteamaculans]|uniref:fumarylacetoacetate hydrolase family protein n=1 Tax=Serratia proteamaculans TaxID=28151 RepID=UPI001C55D7F2|nr:fumarylacetoacetate hydrolase family protein [Serratia proteamaculans]WEO92126.1 fumarylacetoacetate hydrolase family protein [Serratia proteamaculans]CAI1628717.1 4-hydroxyphenylacetate degradation bifunctional isomerase/decarboxylase [Serratia proteamaculans]